MNSFFSTMGKSFQFEGRSSRREYWVFFGCCLLLGCIGLGVDFAMGWFDREAGLGIVSGLVLVIVFLPSLAVSIRRLHDTDKSGWIYLINFIPLIGPFLIIGFMVVTGTQGDNRFGADPYATDDETGLGQE